MTKDDARKLDHTTLEAMRINMPLECDFTYGRINITIRRGKFSLDVAALLEADASRKRRAEIIDAVAAAYILQGALDRMKMLG
jgi:hypothetical protein